MPRHVILLVPICGWGHQTSPLFFQNYWTGWQRDCWMNHFLGTSIAERGVWEPLAKYCGIHQNFWATIAFGNCSSWESCPVISSYCYILVTLWLTCRMCPETDSRFALSLPRSWWEAQKSLVCRMSSVSHDSWNTTKHAAKLSKHW